MNPSAHSCKRIRLCAVDGALVDKVRSDDPKPVELPSVMPLARPPNIYTSYVKKKGELPGPKAADAIGRLLGTPVEANDGRKYPRPFQDDKHDDQKRREIKNAYHSKVRKVASLQQALACLDAAGEPTALAIHMKRDPQIGQALDLAIEWMTRFAEELRSREQSSY